jgi:hypothetical protein
LLGIQKHGRGECELKQLEDENRRVEKIGADQTLSIEAPQVVAEGKF